MSTPTPAIRKVAVIMGAGPGTGAGIAKAFASTHSLALLSRSSTTLEQTISSLPSSADAHPFPNTNAADPESIHAAFKGIKEKWPAAVLDVAVFNPGGRFAPGPFLERDVADLRDNLETGVLGAFTFSQCFLRQLLSSNASGGAGGGGEGGGHHAGTLLFTGATMSIRGGASFSAMAPSKFALRALSQSLAREFGTRNVHVAHIIIDGLIETDRVRSMVGEAKEEGTRLSPEAIGQAYRYLYEQDPSAWTQELDLRPSKESF